jgi:hypothetical protein
MPKYFDMGANSTKANYNSLLSDVSTSKLGELSKQFENVFCGVDVGMAGGDKTVVTLGTRYPRLTAHVHFDMPEPNNIVEEALKKQAEESAKAMAKEFDDRMMARLYGMYRPGTVTVPLRTTYSSSVVPRLPVVSNGEPGYVVVGYGDDKISNPVQEIPTPPKPVAPAEPFVVDTTKNKLPRNIQLND